MIKKVFEELREFKISSVAVDNATSIFLITAMIFLFGLQSYQTMPKEQYPDASLPTVYINTPYFGNSAEEIENLISRPLEKEITSISGIKEVQSTCVQDFSIIIAEFDSDMDIDLQGPRCTMTAGEERVTEFIIGEGDDEQKCLIFITDQNI